MLITIVHQEETGEESRVDVLIFLSGEPLSSSYVVTNGFDIRAACARKQERIYIDRRWFEFHVTRQCRVKIHRWPEPDTMPWVAIKNKVSADLWVNNDSALFSVDFVGVYVNSIERMVVLYIPRNTIAEMKTDEAYLVL